MFRIGRYLCFRELTQKKFAPQYMHNKGLISSEEADLCTSGNLHTICSEEDICTLVNSLTDLILFCRRTNPEILSTLHF